MEAATEAAHTHKSILKRRGETYLEDKEILSIINNFSK